MEERTIPRVNRRSGRFACGGFPWRVRVICTASWRSANLVFADRASPSEQEQWFHENGPDAPELLDHLRHHGAEYDRVLFWSYRYADTYFGFPLVADRAILVPTAEEDPLIHVDVLGGFFERPRGFLFLTPEEEALVALRLPVIKPSAVIGCGLDPVSAPRGSSRASTNLQLDDPFVLYLGRIDPNKGCDALMRHFLRYVDLDRRVQLVMAGPASMPIPDHPSIRRARVRRRGVAGRAALAGARARDALAVRKSRAWCSSRHGIAVCRRW